MKSLTQARVDSRRRIYLARHADVTYFAADGTALDTETVPLNATGRAQAEELSEAFREIAIDRVVTSGLSRTRETAALILGERDIAVEECRELSEIRPGKMTSWAPQFFSTPERLEEFFIGALNRRITPEDTFLGGESFGDFLNRVVPAFESLVAQRDWRSMLIVAHGGTNRALLTHALGAPLEVLGNLEQDPACINVIDMNSDVESPPRTEPPSSPRSPPSRARYLVRLINDTRYAPLKKEIRMTTMEKIFSESREAILALAARSSL